MITINYTYAAPAFLPPWDEVLMTPSEGQSACVLHDWDPQLADEFNREPRQKLPGFEQYIPIPSTRQLWGEGTTKPYDFIPMRKDWQQRQLELMMWATKGKAELGVPTKWAVIEEKEVFRFVSEGTPNSFPIYPDGTLLGAYQRLYQDHAVLTDANAWNTFGKFYRDDVLGFNLSNPIPWAQKSLIMTGNVVKILADTSGMTPSQISRMYKIEALDGTQPAPSLDWLLRNKRHCIVWLTEQGLTKIGDGWIVTRFGHLEYWNVGTPYFLLAKKPWNLINKIDVRLVEPGVPYSPYYP